MNCFLRKYKKTTSLVALAMLLVAWWPLASARGQLAARFDLAIGNYEVLGDGLPPPWTAEYKHLLGVRYGIRFRAIALCIVSKSLMAYANGYNHVSTTAANRKFGHDVFKGCAQEARKTWDQNAANANRD